MACFLCTIRLPSQMLIGLVGYTSFSSSEANSSLSRTKKRISGILRPNVRAWCRTRSSSAVSSVSVWMLSTPLPEKALDDLHRLGALPEGAHPHHVVLLELALDLAVEVAELARLDFHHSHAVEVRPHLVAEDLDDALGIVLEHLAVAEVESVEVRGVGVVLVEGDLRDQLEHDRR